MEEEVDMFYRFYSGILKDLGIPDYESISRMIAVDRTYSFDKYQLFDNIHEELSKLSSDYKLILLTDNWPCVIPYLEKYNLSSYFDRVYVSSMYGVEKDITLGAACRVPHRTRIPNVYLTGQNINSHGALGVLVGSIVTCSEFVPAAAILNQIMESNR